MDLHHWWAAVDCATGIMHHETFRRDEMIDMLTDLGWSDLRLYDLLDTDEDPKQPEVLAELDGVIERYIQRAENDPDLQARGEALQKRVHEIGFHGATSLVAVGVKLDE